MFANYNNLLNMRIFHSFPLSPKNHHRLLLFFHCLRSRPPLNIICKMSKPSPVFSMYHSFANSSPGAGGAVEVWYSEILSMLRASWAAAAPILILFNSSTSFLKALSSPAIILSDKLPNGISSVRAVSRPKSANRFPQLPIFYSRT